MEAAAGGRASVKRNSRNTSPHGAGGGRKSQAIYDAGSKKGCCGSCCGCNCGLWSFLQLSIALFLTKDVYQMIEAMAYCRSNPELCVNFETLEFAAAIVCLLALVCSIAMFFLNSFCGDSKCGFLFIFFCMMLIMLFDAIFLGSKRWHGPSYGGDNDSIKYLNDIRLWTGVPGGLLISFLGLYYGGATQDPPAVMKHCPWDERV